MKRILLIETSDIGARYSAEAVRALGFEPIFLCEMSGYQADPKAQIEEFRYIDCPTRDARALVHTIEAAGLEEIEAVISFQDSRLKVSRELAELLGVRGLDPAVLLLKDKATVARFTPEYSPETISFSLSEGGVPAARLLKMLETSSVILKPSAASGGMGVVLLREPREVEVLERTLRALLIPNSFKEGKWVAQRQIEGDLVSLEGFVEKGEIHELGFTGRRKIGSTESAADFPIDSQLSASARSRAHEALVALIQRSSFRRGYFHVEFLVSGDACVLIDANMGRMGGGPMGELLSLSHGLHPREVYRHVLLVSLFPDREAPNPFSAPDCSPLPRSEVSAVLYGLERGGILKDVRFQEEPVGFHTLILGPGARVSPMGRDDWSWIGILSGRKNEVLHGIECLRIETDDGFHPPCY